MLILGHRTVAEVLRGRETTVLDLIARAYRLHDEGASANPQSVFLRFPGASRNRIIALPAFLGGPVPTAGVKWIASFPGNLEDGLPRASAAILLNSVETGRPDALIEGALISATRTAASAALAAKLLLDATAGAPRDGVALIGCGVINFAILRFLAAAGVPLPAVTVFDRDEPRATWFLARCAEIVPTAELRVAGDVSAAVAAHGLLSLATTAAEPHLGLEAVRPGTVVLNISLRDLTPEAVLAGGNVVDDVEHVCRERTSVHLAERLAGHRDFIGATLGGLLRGTARFTPDPAAATVFSPFGLGVLDLALAGFVHAEAAAAGVGTRFAEFLPEAEPPPAVVAVEEEGL